MDAMHEYVTREFQLSQKTVLEGFSRGGLFSLNWAARHPDKVACIYNDARFVTSRAGRVAKEKARARRAIGNGASRSMV